MVRLFGWIKQRQVVGPVSNLSSAIGCLHRELSAANNTSRSRNHSTRIVAIYAQGNATISHVPLAMTETTGGQELSILRCHLNRLQSSDNVARNVG